MPRRKGLQVGVDSPAGSQQSLPLLTIFSASPQYLQVNSRDKQSEMKSSRSLGDLKGSLLKGSERVRKHSTGEKTHAEIKSVNDRRSDHGAIGALRGGGSKRNFPQAGKKAKSC